jgi:hypothetical protein
METKPLEQYTAGEKRPILTPHQLDIIIDYLGECVNNGHGEVNLVVQHGRLKFIRKMISTAAEEKGDC